MLRTTLCMRPSVVLVRRLGIGCMFGVLALSATASLLNRGTREQDSTSAEITRGVEQMRHLGLEVKNSAQGQRREPSMIAEFVQIVSSKIKEIWVATKGQSKRADQIQEGRSISREVTLQITCRAEETSETVKVLADDADGLEKEIDRFRI